MQMPEIHVLLQRGECGNGTDKWPFFFDTKRHSIPVLRLVPLLVERFSAMGGEENGLLNMANMSDYYFT